MLVDGAFDSVEHKGNARLQDSVIKCLKNFTLTPVNVFINLFNPDPLGCDFRSSSVAEHC